jgi:hypothetical protein
MRKKLVITVTALAFSGALTGAMIAHATGNDGEGALHGPGARDATAAALKITHGGTANSVERDTEDGATWEVEVTRPDGTTVDVRLDDRFELVVVDGDNNDGSGTDGNGS